MYPHQLHYNRPYPDDVCRRMRQGKQIIEIIILKEELIHDIDADTLKVEKAHNKPETPVSTDERQRYEACRKIDNSLSDVVRTVSAYLLLPSPFVHRISTNHTKDWEEKSIYLSLPHNWPPHLIDGLRNSAHDYIVKSVEAEMLAPVLGPNDPYIQYLAVAAQGALDNVNGTINERLGGITPVTTPFG